VSVSNPPKSADEVDSIDLTGKNIEITFWHRYSGSQVTKVLEIANAFNEKNPYGIKVKLEQAGSSYNDVYNKINAAIQGGGDLPALTVAYQNQAALYRSDGNLIDLAPFIQSKQTTRRTSSPTSWRATRTRSSPTKCSAGPLSARWKCSTPTSTG
jgi:ABC-type glycerol-3-phosphate transport system substrate-binding protein